MAEDEDKKTTDKKRRLRSSTETIRERSEKHQLSAAAPVKVRRTHAFVSGFFAPLRALGRQIAKLGRFRIFRIIGRILLPRYIRNSWTELRQVTWPDRRTTWRLTWAVIVFSVIFSIIVAIVDFILNKIFKELILQS